MVPVRKALASRCAQSLGARSRVRSVSLSVSLTLSPGYQRAPATAKRRSSPARKSLVFMKAFRSGDLLAPERARVRSRILRAKAQEMPGGPRRHGEMVGGLMDKRQRHCERKFTERY